ncbi:MAG TPA: VOC family protein [Pyrinomonadaceae bacterium]
MKAHFILYVADQQKAAEFYSAVLDLRPTLDVPGMTEFTLGEDAVLGLMPVAGAERLLRLSMSETSGPRAELYLVVGSAAEYHSRAIAAGAREISPLGDRDWGHTAAYSIDADGNVLAFAEIT